MFSLFIQRSSFSLQLISNSSLNEQFLDEKKCLCRLFLQLKCEMRNFDQEGLGLSLRYSIRFRSRKVHHWDSFVCHTNKVKSQKMSEEQISSFNLTDFVGWRIFSFAHFHFKAAAGRMMSLRKLKVLPSSTTWMMSGRKSTRWRRWDFNWNLSIFSPHLRPSRSLTSRISSHLFF